MYYFVNNNNNSSYKQVLIKLHSLTGVKFIVLCKQLDKNHIYIHFNNRTLSIVLYHKHNHLANNDYLYMYIYIQTHTYTRKHERARRHACTNPPTHPHTHQSGPHHPLKHALQLVNYQYSLKNCLPLNTWQVWGNSSCK